jgi:hypothetical protein
MNDTVYSNPSSLSFQLTTAARVLAALAAWDLKQEKANQYRCNSPLRPGSNSHGFVLVLEGDGEHGAYFDHVTGEGGSLYDLAAHLGVAVPATDSRPPIATTKRVYSGLADYAEAHGVSKEIFAAAGWTETARDGRPALAVPTDTGTRYRFLDGAKPTYKSPAGYSRCWYRLPHAAQLAKDTGQPLVIGNGEASTVVGQHYGVAACAVTGGEHKTLPPDLLDALKATYSGPVLVAFDCLDKGAAVAPLLAEQLKAAGFDAQAIDLGLGKGGDLADFCRLHGAQSVAALGQRPALSPSQSSPSRLDQLQHNPRTRLYHASELLTLPPQAWLLDRLVPQGAIGFIWGESGIGKSFLMIHLALTVAQNEAVVYIADEGWHGYGERIRAWMRHNKRDMGQLYFRQELLAVDEAAVSDLIAQIAPLQPKLVILDTVATVMPGADDNAARDIGLLSRHCRLIAQATGAAVIGVHHPTKDGKTYRGSGALKGNFDFVMAVEADDDQLRITCQKMRDDEPFPDQRVAFLPVDIGLPTKKGRVVVPGDLVVQTRDDPLTPLQRKIVEALHGDGEGLTSGELGSLLRCPESSLHSALKKLKGFGFLRQDRRGAPYILTEDGQRMLTQADLAVKSSEPGTVNRLFFPAATNAASPGPDSNTAVESRLSTSVNEPVVPDPDLAATPIETPVIIGSPLPTSNDSIATPIPSLESGAAPTPHSTPTLSLGEVGERSGVDSKTLALEESDRALLITLSSKYQQRDRRDYLDLSRLFSPFRLHRAQLEQLQAKGFLERERANSPRFRLSDAAWAALGRRIVRIDLSTF